MSPEDASAQIAAGTHHYLCEMSQQVQLHAHLGGSLRPKWHIAMSSPSVQRESVFGLLAPLRQLFQSPFLRNRAVIWVLSFALIPFLILTAVLQFGLRFEQSIWVLGSYFCLFWAFYFYGLITPSQGLFKRGLCYLLFTTTCGIPLLLAWQQFPIIRNLYSGTNSSSLFGQLIGFTLGVGLFEELCKALPLLCFSMRRGKLSYQECMFLGVMSGLGFALAEVVHYSLNYAQKTAELSALLVAQAAGESRTVFGGLNTDRFVSKVKDALPVMMDNHGTILTIQIVRFIPLPLLHAVWSGTVGWFIAAATQTASRTWGPIALGIGGVSILHGVYDVFSSGILAIILAALSILVFLCYLGIGNTATLQRNDDSPIFGHKIIQCVNCGQKLRVSSKGQALLVTCPSCHCQFETVR